MRTFTGFGTGSLSFDPAALPVTTASSQLGMACFLPTGGRINGLRVSPQ
jgi:hypothetical protein